MQAGEYMTPELKESEITAHVPHRASQKKKLEESNVNFYIYVVLRNPCQTTSEWLMLYHFSLHRNVQIFLKRYTQSWEISINDYWLYTCYSVMRHLLVSSGSTGYTFSYTFNMRTSHPLVFLLTFPSSTHILCLQRPLFREATLIHKLSWELYIHTSLLLIRPPENNGAKNSSELRQQGNHEASHNFDIWFIYICF